jgi:hypothetical protein
METPAPVAPTPAGATTAVSNIRLTPDPDVTSINATKGGVYLWQECRAGDIHCEFGTVNSDQDRQRAEKIFKKEERAPDSREAMTEYQAGVRATREKTARLKPLRLD